MTSFGRVSLLVGPALCRIVPLRTFVEHSSMVRRRCGVVPLLAVLLACAARETWAGNAVGSAIARLRGETGSGVVEETFSWDDVPSEIATDDSGRRHRVSAIDPPVENRAVENRGECAFDPPAPGGHGWLSQRGMCPGVGGNCTPTGGLALSGSPPSLPSNCSKECYNIGTCNQELGRCDCPRGTKGESCEDGLKTPRRKGAGDCLNQCNYRGRCDSGFCKCDAGFFAADCSTYLDLDGKPRLIDDEWEGRVRPPPRIYIYPLPPKFNGHVDLRFTDRPLEQMIYERLLSSHHRVANPEDADLFFLPIPTRSAFRGGLDNVNGWPEVTNFFHEAIEYVDNTWEWSKKHEWRNTIMVFTGDWGPCEWFSDKYSKKEGELGYEAFWKKRRRINEVIANAIVLTHWGLTIADDLYLGGGPCFDPAKDVLIPPVNPHMQHSPFDPDGWKAPMGTRRIEFDVGLRGSDVPFGSEGAMTEQNEPRRWLLFFAGAWEDKKAYADRRAIADAMAGREQEGIHVVQHAGRFYEMNYASSTFCIAPTGSGWGRRVNLATHSGCIPVIVQDNIAAPYDDVLPYDEFSVRVAKADIAKIPDIVKAITPEKLDRMRQQLACAARALQWSSILGSDFGEGGENDAFALLMLTLQHRLVTHVKPEGWEKLWSPNVPIKDACDIPKALSCLNQTQPICRRPCSKQLRRSGRDKILEMHGVHFPPGGALCTKDDTPSKEVGEKVGEEGLTFTLGPSNVSNTCES